MKIKNFVLSALLTSGLSGMAMANTFEYVHIAGAPAFRQDSNNTINSIVTAAGGGLTATVASSTGAYQSANQNQWLIPNYAPGIDLVVNATWTGSHSGLESVASGTIKQNFIANNTGSIATPTTAAAAATAYQPQISLSNTYQATSGFLGTKTFKGPTNTTTFTATYASLTQSAALGVEPYQWVASPGFPLSNVSSAQIQALYKNGALPLAFFTGNSADQGTLVYGLTRDSGSGARSAAVIESGVGLKTLLTSYRVTVTGGTNNANGNRINGSYSGTPIPYPKGLIASTGIWNNTDGDTGYPSFGGTSQNGLLLALTSNNGGAYYTITFFNASDAAEAIAAGAVSLNYNGWAPTTANIKEGKYTFWAYQFLYRLPSLSGNANNFANSIVSNWIPTLAASTLNVSRSDDGAVPTPNY